MKWKDNKKARQKKIASWKGFFVSLKKPTPNQKY